MHHLQEKKKLEEERQKELNALFAQAIKQPKVPVGEQPLYLFGTGTTHSRYVQAGFVLAADAISL